MWVRHGKCVDKIINISDFITPLIPLNDIMKKTRQNYQTEKERTKRRNWNNRKKKKKIILADSNQMKAVMHPETPAEEEERKQIRNSELEFSGVWKQLPSTHPSTYKQKKSINDNLQETSFLKLFLNWASVQ